MQIPVQIRFARWRVPTQFSRSYLLADGTGRDLYLPEAGSSVGHPVWLPDGVGLRLTVRDSTPARGQIWFVSFPGGEARRFTNDPTDYSICSLDLTRDVT